MPISRTHRPLVANASGNTVDVEASTIADVLGLTVWGDIGSKPTTLAGYGITDAAPLVHTHGAADITSGTLNHARLGSGGGGASKFLREDNTWQNISVPAALDDLSDVVITTPATGHILRHNGTNFVNVLGTTHFAAASHTHDAADINSGTIAPARLGSGSGGATKFLREDSTWQTVSGGGTPGGSDTHVQFNDGGAFGGDAGLTYNKTTDTLSSVIFSASNYVITGHAGLGYGINGLKMSDIASIQWGSTSLDAATDTMLKRDSANTLGIMRSTTAGEYGDLKLRNVLAGAWQGSVIAAAYLGSGSGGATKFLREDNTWQAIGAGGTTFIATGTGTSLAMGTHLTWLTLSANSADITGTTLTTVMTITGVSAGRYNFRCNLVFQTTATGTGIQCAVNHTGTTTQFIIQNRWVDTLATATTGGVTGAGSVAAGNIMGSHSTRTKNAIIGAVNVTVDAANSDCLMIIEGTFVVSVSGDVEIKLAAESAGLVCRAMQGSSLELNKLS